MMKETHSTHLRVNELVKRAEVLIVTIRTGFPNGMAAARRIQFIARALLEADVPSAVVHINTTGRQGDFGNTEVSGIHCGVPFKYLSGAVTRPKSFWSRRLHTALGFMRMCKLVLTGGVRGDLKAIYYYERSSGSLVILMLICKFLGIRFILDLVESPIAMENQTSLLGKFSLKMYRLIGLRYADRVSVISYHLLNMLKSIRGSSENILFLPILGDDREINISREARRGQFIISLSPGYRDEILLVAKAFSSFRCRFPFTELYITGGLRNEELKRILHSDKASSSLSDVSGIVCCGYIPRNDLLKLYASSSAAIVALGDDQRSLTRMPTKIAEYSFCGLPIITGDIGDVGKYFKDGFNAFLYQPGDCDSLSNAMERSMDEEVSTSVGRNGKKLANERFSYRAYSNSLDSLCLE